MNLQNLYRATTKKDDKCCHKTFRNFQAKENTEKHLGSLKKSLQITTPCPINV